MCTSIFLKRIIVGILAVHTVISVSYQSKVIAGVNLIRMVVSRASQPPRRSLSQCTIELFRRTEMLCAAQPYVYPDTPSYRMPDSRLEHCEPDPDSIGKCVFSTAWHDGHNRPSQSNRPMNGPDVSRRRFTDATYHRLSSFRVTASL